MKKGYLEDYEQLQDMLENKQKDTFHMAENFEQLIPGEGLSLVLDAEEYRAIK